MAEGGLGTGIPNPLSEGRLFCNVVVKTDSNKSQYWMLNRGGGNLMRNRIFP